MTFTILIFEEILKKLKKKNCLLVKVTFRTHLNLNVIVI